MKEFVTSARVLIKMASVYEYHKIILLLGATHSENTHTEKNHNLK